MERHSRFRRFVRIPFDACSSSCNLVYDGNGDGFVGSVPLGLLTEFELSVYLHLLFLVVMLCYQGHDYETVLIGNQCWFAETSSLDSTKMET